MLRKNRLAVFGLTAGLLGGGAAGVALTSPGVAHGEGSSSDASNPTTTRSPERAGDAFLKDTLAPLVDDGTITQAQADAVIKAIEAARPEGGWRGGPPGSFGRERGAFKDVFGAAADKLGVSAEDLRAALRDGKTIADVAKSKDVAVSDVVDAMVAAVKTDLAQAVKDGRLSQADADQHLSDVRARITALVNGDAPRFEHRRQWPGRPSADAQNSNESFTVPA
jgi:hypothetical protein